MEMDTLLSLGQVHGRRLRAAVFDDVLQRLLRHAEQAERGVGRDTRAARALPELDLNAILTSHVMAETCDGRREPEQFKFRRVKVMRKAVDVATDVPGPFGQSGKTLGERWGHLTSLRAKALDLHTQQRELLAQVVVQIAGDAVAF